VFHLSILFFLEISSTFYSWVKELIQENQVLKEKREVNYPRVVLAFLPLLHAPLISMALFLSSSLYVLIFILIFLANGDVVVVFVLQTMILIIIILALFPILQDSLECSQLACSLLILKFTGGKYPQGWVITQDSIVE